MVAHRTRAIMWMATLALASGVLVSVAHAGPAPRGAVGRTDAAKHVYERLLAPCCWVQTLEVHESDVAELLRDEIAQRLQHGESARAIEDDLATRFGERIRAVPRDHDSRELLGMSVMTSLAMALFVLLLGAWRWVRRDRALRLEARGAPPDSDAALSSYDEQLERALRDVP
jgi:cytochrome c-type biogenesis protein CcmH